ncbi:MAG: YqzL family protein [Bacilli bacterium]|nr:YqzL family protein [Bacilli bacterium]
MKSHHYINRGDFMNDVVWNLFRKTGDIKYYILLKNINKKK